MCVGEAYELCIQSLQIISRITVFGNLTRSVVEMSGLDTVRNAQRAKGPATIMAIGTANPSNVVEQSTFADYNFRITNSEHMTELKEKFRRVCENSTIKKRYLHITEDILKKNPSMRAYMAPSLDARQEMLVTEVPKLGKEAATKAVHEWGRPVSDITHLVFCSNGVDMPGADYQLVKLLGLLPSVKRVMLYHQGCFAGGTVLRIAKDLAENNKGARVLVVCSEMTVLTFRGPDDAHFDNLIGQALFGDGAAALIVGADPVRGIEKPIFEIASTAQVILSESEGAIEGRLNEAGLVVHLVSQVPAIIAKNIETSLVEAFEPLGISDWNSLFWIAHPGGPAILDQLEARLRLKPEKLSATRHVLSEYGNMWSACVFFVMDEMRRRSAGDGEGTTGEGLEWGVLFGFGPGLTVETVVLHSVPAA